MKLAFLIPSLSNNGPNVFTLNLINALLETNLIPKDDIHVFYFKDKSDNLLEFSVKTEKINLKNTFKLPYFDIVHSTMFKADLLCAFLSLLPEKNAKYISGIHNEIDEDLSFNYGRFKGFIFSKLWKTALNIIKNIIVSSHPMKEYYQKRLSKRSRSTVIPYGIKIRTNEEKCIPDEHKKLSELHDKHTVIGACGLLIERKNYEILIDYIAINEDVCIVLVGDGPHKEYLNQLAIKNKVTERLLILGFQENSISYYKYFDIYALSSFSEGFGLAMLEALGQGIPILLAELPIYKDFFDSNSVGYFDPHSIKSLGMAFNTINENKELYSQMSLTTFNKHFVASHMAQQHILLYRSLLD